MSLFWWPAAGHASGEIGWDTIYLNNVSTLYHMRQMRQEPEKNPKFPHTPSAWRPLFQGKKALRDKFLLGDFGGFRRFFQEGMGSGYKPWLGADFGGRIKAGDYAPELNPLAGVLSLWGFGAKWILRVLCASIVCNIMMCWGSPQERVLAAPFSNISKYSGNLRLRGVVLTIRVI